MICFVILGLVAAAGCTRKTGDKGTKRIKGITIEEINLNPDEYYDREIVVRGLITQSYDVPLLKPSRAGGQCFRIFSERFLLIFFRGN